MIKVTKKISRRSKSIAESCPSMKIQVKKKSKRNNSAKGINKKVNSKINTLNLLNKKLKILMEKKNSLKKEEFEEKVLKTLPFFMKKARELKNSINSQSQVTALALYYNNLSNCCIVIKALNKALDIINWTLENMKINDFFILSILFHTRGTIKNRQSCFSEAIKNFRDAYDKAFIQLNLVKLKKRGIENLEKIKIMKKEILSIVEMIVRAKISELNILANTKFIRENSRYLIFELNSLKLKYIAKYKERLTVSLIQNYELLNKKVIRVNLIRSNCQKSIQTEPDSKVIINPKFQLEASFSQSNFTQNNPAPTEYMFESSNKNFLISNIPKSTVKNSLRSSDIFRSTLQNIFSPSEKLLKSSKIKSFQNSISEIEPKNKNKFLISGSQLNDTLFNSANPQSWYNSPAPTRVKRKSIKKAHFFKESQFKKYSGDKGGDVMKINVLKRGKSLTVIDDITRRAKKSKTEKRAKSGFFCDNRKMKNE